MGPQDGQHLCIASAIACLSNFSIVWKNKQKIIMTDSIAIRQKKFFHLDLELIVKLLCLSLSTIVLQASKAKKVLMSAQTESGS